MKRANSDRANQTKTSKSSFVKRQTGILFANISVPLSQPVQAASWSLKQQSILLKLGINSIKQIGIVAGISLLGLLSTSDYAQADTVNMLNSTTVTATGTGAAGVPSITNFNIPAGRNRVILAIPMFERDHCLSIANCTINNTAGTGLGSNYASPNLTGLNATTATPQLTARFVGAGGTVDKKNALLTTGTPPGDLRFIIQRWTPATPNDQYSKTFFSEESYHIAIFESEIQTLLGGASSGNISLSLPDVVAPKSPGDDAIFMVFVFEGMTQTNVGIVRSGVDLTSASMDSPVAGNFSRSITAFDAGQAPTLAGDGVLALGVSTVGAPANNGGYSQMTGFSIKENAFTTNSGGVFDAVNQPSAGNSSEPSGFSATAQFRNGVPTLPLTLQSAAPSNILTMGGMAAVFTLVSATPAPDVALTKSDGGVNFTQGSNGTYTLTARNNGTAATTGTITIVDTLPAELTYVSATGTGWTCSYDSATRKVTCTSTSAIAANSNGNPITLTVTASSGAGTTITNTATISGGGEGTLDNTNNSSSDTTSIVPSTPPPTVSVSGNVFNDIDASKLKAASGEDYTAADITAVLLDASNKVVSTAAIDSTGNYTINSVVAGSYSVKIIKTPSTPLTVGAVIPPAADVLPGTFVATGENLNGVIDGTVDRTQSITVGSSNVANVNFGVQTLLRDYGDAPATYGSPSHFIATGLQIGSTAPDAETAPVAPLDGTGDGADETGLVLPTLSAGATTYQIPNIPVTNSTGSVAKLVGWIDFNKNGVFDSNEAATVDVPNSGAQTVTLNWSGLSGVTAGNTYARFRLTSDATVATGTANTSSPTAAASNGEVEDYEVTIAAPSGAISGTVFEDPNYGGGAGRPLSTPTTSPRDGATVELYKSDGTYVSSTTTTSGGKYTFSGVSAGDYSVRVVNSTVTSSRTGYVAGLLPVQTFRTDASTGTAVADPDRVGGEKPNEVDAAANTGSQTLTTLNTGTNEVQSIAPVKVGSSAVTDVDFGFNFDTIVNTNDSGQGSVRQFITNSNALSNTLLAQAGLTAGKETSIFMIPGQLGLAIGASTTSASPGLRAGLANQIVSSGGNKGAAVIALASNFTISDADTSLDATTQTTNVGDTNSGTVGTGGTVGVDKLPLSVVPKPEIVFDLKNVPTNTNAIIITGANTLIKGFASYGYRTTGNLGTTLKAAIVVKSNVTNANATTIQQLLGGTNADGTDPLVPTIDVGYSIQTEGAANISNNFFAYNSDAIEFDNFGPKVTFFDNEVAYNGPKDNNTSNASGIYADQMETNNGVSNLVIRGNLVRNSSKPGYASAQGQGVQLSNASFVTVDNNTFTDNNVYGINASTSDTTITKNIVTGTKATELGIGDGIVVFYGGKLPTGLRNKISQNSIYQNAKLGIDFAANAVVDPNDGLVSSTQANNGMDYPVITASTLASGTLTVKGFVGSNPAGSVTFKNATIEFFIADDDGNQNGAVIAGDGKSKPHGEGKTYIGSCTADANGLFGTATNPCVLSNVPATLTDAKNITSTATDTAGNTSEFSAGPIASNPNVLLVKRITRINGSTMTVGGDNLAAYKDELTNPYDDNTITIPTQPNPTDPPKDTDKWPTLNTFMLGGTDGGNIKPNDELDYTIYFLSTGNVDSNNVLFCDRVPNNVTFIPTAFNMFNPKAANGLAGDRGMLAQVNGISASYSNMQDGDAAQYFPPGSNPTSIYPKINCGGANDNGAIVVNLGNLPSATAPGTPTGSYGWVRFKGKVK